MSALVLVLGLLLFLGVHSVRMVAEGWRSERIERMGVGAWKGAYSLLSLIGILLIIWGFAQMRGTPTVLWEAPSWLRQLVGPVTLVASILATAAYVPRSRLRALVEHPMLAGVALWALVHLLANGRLADVLLFGAFLVWSVFDFFSARRRTHAGAQVGAQLGGLRPSGSWANDLVSIVIGTVIWYVVAAYLHEPLFGVPAFT